MHTHTHIPFWILSASHSCFISSPPYYPFLPTSPLLTLISFHFVWSFTESKLWLFVLLWICHYLLVVHNQRQCLPIHYWDHHQSIHNSTWKDRARGAITDHWLIVNSPVFGRPIAHWANHATAIKAWVHWLCHTTW